MGKAKHTPATHEVLDWLREREANARLLSAQAEDRDGWLEDAMYFDAAAARVWACAEVVACLKDVLRIATAASIGVAGNQKRLDRARAAIATAEPAAKGGA